MVGKKGSSGGSTSSGGSSKVEVSAPNIYVQGVANKWLNVAKKWSYWYCR